MLLLAGVRREDAGRVHTGEPGAADGPAAAAGDRKCLFANLPDPRSGRWGEGLMAEKMKECVWVRPELVAEVEFVEWTPDGHLRHARFVRLKQSAARY
jgi:ATP-dependent DNA ligase